MSDKILERCCYCKCVKDHYGEYNRNIVIDQNVEQYSRTADISDTICPECMKKNHPEYKKEENHDRL